MGAQATAQAPHSDKTIILQRSAKETIVTRT